MFDHPVAVMVDKHKVIVREVEQARDLLMNDWPSRRGPRHRDALETCLKVLDGHRSTVDAVSGEAPRAAAPARNFSS